MPISDTAADIIVLLGEALDAVDMVSADQKVLMNFLVALKQLAVHGFNNVKNLTKSANWQPDTVVDSLRLTDLLSSAFEFKIRLNA